MRTFFIIHLVDRDRNGKPLRYALTSAHSRGSGNPVPFFNAIWVPAFAATSGMKFRHYALAAPSLHFCPRRSMLPAPHEGCDAGQVGGDRTSGAIRRRNAMGSA